MENVIIIGAGQHCKVVLYNLKEQGKYNPCCILDSNPDISGTFIESVIVEHYENNDVSIYEKFKNKYNTNKFFIGFGSMKYRKHVFQNFIMNGWEAINIFHPNAVISPSATIGKGVLIEAGCLITPSPIIKDNVVVNTGSQVNHDNVIEDHVYIASGVILSGGVHIQSNSLIDDGVIVTLGTKIGSNCIIGAGSVVTKNVVDNVIAYGNPCKVIKENDRY